MIEKAFPARGLSVLMAALLLWTGAGDLVAGPPAIINMRLGGGGPRLSISSDLGVTNQIQSATNLSAAAWVALTNIYVTPSPYEFIDTVTAPPSERFYRVLIPAAQTNQSPAGMVLIPAGAFRWATPSTKASITNCPSTRFMGARFTWINSRSLRPCGTS